MSIFKNMGLIFTLLAVFSTESFAAARVDDEFSSRMTRVSISQRLLSEEPHDPLAKDICHLPDELIENVFAHLRIHTLKSLRENKNKNIREIASKVLLRHPHLSINITEVNPEFFAFLNQFQMKNPNLGIRSSIRQDSFLQFLEASTHEPSSFQVQAVTDLSFSRGAINHLDVLVDLLPRFPNLTGLRMLEFGIGNTALERIVNAAPRLRKLFIPNPDNCCFYVSRAGLEFLAARLPELTHLDLSNHYFRDEDVAILAQFYNLQHLVLSGTSVGDQGAASIATINSLRHLELRFNYDMTIAGVEALVAKFSRHPGSYLDLRSLTKLSMEDSARFRQDPRLTYVKAYFGRS